MLTMSYFWKWVLLCCTCLLVFPAIVTARWTCLRSGDCLPGFYCHTGTGSCLSCEQCNDARGNIRLCEKECIITSIPTSPTPELHTEGDLSSSHEPTIRVVAVIVAIVVAAVVILVVVTVLAVTCWRRQCKPKRKLTTCVLETGYNIDPSEMPTLTPLDYAIPDESVNHTRDCAIPDESVNHTRDCAIPDESVNQRTLLLPPHSSTES